MPWTKHYGTGSDGGRDPDTYVSESQHQCLCISAIVTIGNAMGSGPLRRWTESTDGHAHPKEMSL